jgi:hypothetical protein
LCCTQSCAPPISVETMLAADANKITMQDS